ncbi:hypothetical protein NDU88_001824 [Pleurodeles waltl]|uniref:Uncharacterized protein n=1 Tax=Pleurodeles waltl TaxID=8319 RepID=A0AAV7RA71_PLEWA|nr:hypothetical protein NDU88_001824 [Pleurodeles waltl]
MAPIDSPTSGADAEWVLRRPSFTSPHEIRTTLKQRDALCAEQTLCPLRARLGKGAAEIGCRAAGNLPRDPETTRDTKCLEKPRGVPCRVRGHTAAAAGRGETATSAIDWHVLGDLADMCMLLLAGACVSLPPPLTTQKLPHVCIAGTPREMTF